MQVFSISMKVILNKVAALTLGSEGMGVLSILQSMSMMLKTFFGFGIPQSSVRDISQANKSDNSQELALTTQVTKKLIIISAIIGFSFVLVFSPYFSIFTFGDTSYTYSFIVLSFVVLLNIFSDGYLGILKGVRKLKILAKATIYSSLTGVLTGVPLYYMFGEEGIAPTLLSVAIFSFIFSIYYVSKLNFERNKITIQAFFEKISSMVWMGGSLMLVTFLGLLSETLIKAYVSNHGGLSELGIYQAGLTILSGYFGFLLVAMMTDYYPRISEMSSDNSRLTTELNQQGKVGLIIISPLIVFFVFTMSFFVEVLYSSEFLLSVDYMKFAIFWTLITVVSNPLDMILMAKQNVKVLLLTSVLYRLTSTLMSILLYHIYGMEGLGIAMLLMGVGHIMIMKVIVGYLYDIKLNIDTQKILLVSMFLSALALYVSKLDNRSLAYTLGLILCIISLIYSNYNFKKYTNINVVDFIIRKVRGKNG